MSLTAHFGLLIAAVAALRAAIADPRGGDAAAVTAAELLGVTAPHVWGGEWGSEPHRIPPPDPQSPPRTSPDP